MSDFTLDDLRALAAYKGSDAHALFAKRVAASALRHIPDPDDLRAVLDFASTMVGELVSVRDHRVVHFREQVDRVRSSLHTAPQDDGA